MSAGQGGSQAWSSSVPGAGAAEEAVEVVVEPVTRAEAARLAGRPFVPDAPSRTASVAVSVVDADSVFADRLERAWRYFQEDKIGQALSLARELAWQMPSPAGAKLLLARCFIRRREYDKALDILDSIPEAGRTPEILYYAGVSLGRLGRREEALERLGRSRAGTSDPFLRKRAHDLQIQLGAAPATCPSCGKAKLYHPDAAVDNDPLCASCREKAAAVAAIPPPSRSTGTRVLLTVLILLFAALLLSLFLPVWDAGHIAWLRGHLPFLAQNRAAEHAPPPSDADSPGHSEMTLTTPHFAPVEDAAPAELSPAPEELTAPPAPPPVEPEANATAEMDSSAANAFAAPPAPPPAPPPVPPPPPPPSLPLAKPPSPIILPEPEPEPVPETESALAYRRWISADLDGDGTDDLASVTAEPWSGIRIFRNWGGGYVCVASHPLEARPVGAELAWRGAGTVLIVTDADGCERRYLFFENRIFETTRR